MKIVVFAPHPDDEIYGAGGSILKWIEEGHDVHIVYVTDNRMLITWGRKENKLIEEEAQEYLDLTEEEIGKIGIQEAINVARAFGLADNNFHLYKFHDQDAKNRIQEGIKLSKEIIKDADRIVIPSDNNPHPDHQSTHFMVKQAALDLNLTHTEFYVYGINNIIKSPKNKQIKIIITNYRDRAYDILSIYKTQLALKDSRLGWLTLKRKRSERFGVFSLSDVGKFYNF
ncbi:MAG: PIG-L deacetylase family protein [Promethearchaeota archaeon]